MKNKKGSTIVWAVMLIMVLMVIVGASLSFAYINYNKSITYRSSTQAELTAESVAQALADQIEKATVPGTYEGEDQVTVTKTKNLIPDVDEDPTIISESEITIPNTRMGKVNSITITRNQNNKLTITVKATYSGQNASVDVVMQRDNTNKEQWTVHNYERAKS